MTAKGILTFSSAMFVGGIILYHLLEYDFLLPAARSVVRRQDYTVMLLLSGGFMVGSALRLGQPFLGFVSAIVGTVWIYAILHFALVLQWIPLFAAALATLAILAAIAAASGSFRLPVSMPPALSASGKYVVLFAWLCLFYFAWRIWTLDYLLSNFLLLIFSAQIVLYAAPDIHSFRANAFFIAIGCMISLLPFGARLDRRLEEGGSFEYHEILGFLYGVLFFLSGIAICVNLFIQTKQAAIEDDEQRGSMIG